ncbi:MAG: ABC transporter permease [Fimbriimonadaceae bacterium]|nr:ABC transporter permease [Fimbriimonadaceae bacterium]
MGSEERKGLGRLLGRRVLFGLLSLLFLTLATFLLDEIAPGDAANIRAGEKANAEQVARVRSEMGLDRPWPIRYVEYLGGLVRGDMGRSYFGAQEPVTEIIGQALPLTLLLAIPAILTAALLGIVLGTLAAVNQNRWPDQAILGFSTLGVTVPNFVLAPILVYIFAVQMDRLPTGWETTLRAPVIYYLILPVLVLSARPAATLTRLTRASMVDTLGQEFIKLARAKGVPPGRLVIRHALRNAILPVVTATGTSFGFLLTGSFIIETIFTMPGMGFKAINAIQNADTPVILGCVLVTGGLFILANLLVDLVQPLLDPRIREAGE